MQHRLQLCQLGSVRHLQQWVQGQCEGAAHGPAEHLRQQGAQGQAGRGHGHVHGAQGSSILGGLLVEFVHLQQQENRRQTQSMLWMAGL